MLLLLGRSPHFANTHHRKERQIMWVCPSLTSMQKCGFQEQLMVRFSDLCKSLSSEHFWLGASQQVEYLYTTCLSLTHLTIMIEFVLCISVGKMHVLSCLSLSQIASGPCELEPNLLHFATGPWHHWCIWGPNSCVKIGLHVPPKKEGCWSLVKNDWNHDFKSYILFTNGPLSTLLHWRLPCEARMKSHMGCGCRKLGTLPNCCTLQQAHDTRGRPRILRKRTCKTTNPLLFLWCKEGHNLS